MRKETGFDSLASVILVEQWPFCNNLGSLF
jgi:hypothetical protein